MDLSSATIGQLMVPVSDLDRAVEYYRDRLGLQFLFAAPPGMAFFQHASHSTLAERGVKFQVQPHVVHRTPEIELWLAEFRDPDGNLLALMAQAPVRRT